MKTFITLFFAILSTIGISQNISISDVRPGKVGVKAFELGSSGTVNLEGIGGAFQNDGRLIVYYAWIIDSETRKVKWHQFDELRGNDYHDWYEMDEFDYDIQLEKGSYELYFAAGFGNRWRNNDGWISGFASLNDILDDIFNSRDREKYRWSVQNELYVKLSGDNVKASNMDNVLDAQNDLVVAQFIGVKDNDYFEQGFNVKSKTNMRVYAIGEGDRDSQFDYASIYNVVTREKIFEFNYRNSTIAGGAEKNILTNEELVLEKGSYKIVYSSDDSHSFEEWNALPPDDPYFYGISLYAASGSDMRNIEAYNPPANVDPIVDITRVRDNELKALGLSVTKNTEVRIYALGEGDRDDLVDYGWIMNAETMETVWEMRPYRTDHAGGADKNREIADVIELKKGDYIVYYKTDDSHSYNDWNSSRPRDPELWGISIWAANESDINYLEIFRPDDYKSENIIASMVMVEDNEYYRESFVLNKETKIRVIATGEGSYDEMHDFGWIKDMDSGRTVWEMEYRDTDHAGGAKKNRMVNQTITLPKGEYRVYFETDGSHSFEDWNADPPSNPAAYGIRILREE